MNIKRWYRSMLFSHMMAFCLESAVFAAFLCSIVYFIHKAQPQFDHLTISLTVLIWISATIIRFYKSWDNRALWKILEKKWPNLQGNTFIVENFILGEGHFPNEEMKALATQQMEKTIADIHYPWGLIFKQHKPEYLIALFFMAIPALLHFVDLSIRQNTPVKISLHPPAYLNLSVQDIYNLNHPVGVYPGTLMKCVVNEDEKDIVLRDNRGSLYLPTSKTENSATYEIRILKNTHFKLAKSGEAWKNWNVDLLKDHNPKVKWLGQTEPPKNWEKIKPYYIANDDIALGDSFITVNGDELEYAGSPNGRKSYQYSWEFDPLEHINLSGGNVELQITSYDQDRVLGPKFAKTKAITWEYLGVMEQTKRTLAALENLENKMKQRKDKLKQSPQSANNEVSKAFDKLQEEMDKNPVLPKELQQLASEMASQEKSMQNELQQRGANSQSQKKELDNIKRNELYTQHIKQALKSIMSTVKTAELIKDLNETSDKLAAGEKVSEEKMEELYEKLEEALKDSGASPQDMANALNQMESAQLSQKLGQSKEASKSLQQLAENLRQQSQNNSQSSELANKFQEKMEMLQSLISGQTDNTNKYFELLKGKGHHQAQNQKVRKLIEDIANSEPVKKFQDFTNKILSSQNQSIPKDMLQELSKPNSPIRQGQKLSQLTSRLRAVERGQTLPRSAGLMSPGEFKKMDVDKQLKSDYLKNYHQLIGQSVANQNSGDLKTLEPVIGKQDKLSKDGKTFAEEFRQEFSILIPSPIYFDLADQGAIYADNSLKLLKQPHPHAPRSMSQAQSNWQRLLDLLKQMQQQSQQQQQQQQLSIGKDGQLKFNREQKVMQGEDGEEFQHRRDHELELPEEFQNAKLIEKRLKDELKQIKDEDERNQFRAYMLDLLE